MASVVAICISEKKGVMKAIYPNIPIGAFAENFLTEGIEVAAFLIGTRLIVGNGTLEITQIGKECHKECAIRKQIGDCVMPRKGVFAIVLKEERSEAEMESAYTVQNSKTV
ncbi:MAG: hypothetical protein Q4E53_11990 [Eubacteriales bacterium]|nr:hypothetical protein [Eubacteriales bacterium]